MSLEKTKIKSYTDLDVYQRSYKLSIIVCTKVIVKLPSAEKFGLTDQLGRSSKAIPRLIAEGFGKKHQKRGFHKYLDDAMAENNESIVSLCQIRDIYANNINAKSVQLLIDEYEIVGKQMFRLKQSWSKFS
ncbi:MAG: S23 ribosomal protein [Candidatus Moranbacteria bacterium GW2011_GWE1_36_7]|nr:MAG: S23 ribosomal protein [Candidatus Moranbacteria bacterium GW2011_GWD2_36_12]KKQ07063.1 MAG: S23 ribosomal protein [Candidatus Moranbacteria bacterium GW2011_GWE2_36_40]KKQ13613.1 MAG: S23 ribosomal protein [Candidatus Moranbacteria bacterium GW2011_GWE1_36_7]MDD5463711.1 four helix bundle protein [Candidatus Moranbacteria bacterium]